MFKVLTIRFKILPFSLHFYSKNETTITTKSTRFMHTDSQDSLLDRIKAKVAADKQKKVTVDNTVLIANTKARLEILRDGIKILVDQRKGWYADRRKFKKNYYKKLESFSTFEEMMVFENSSLHQFHLKEDQYIGYNFVIALSTLKRLRAERKELRNLLKDLEG